MKLFEPAHDGLRIAAVEVDLGAVASREDRRFLYLRRRDQVPQCRTQRLHPERNRLPHLERRGRVVEAEGIKGHGVTVFCRSLILTQYARSCAADAGNALSG